MGKKSGFSLIELIIVVAIILVIAAIAIPSLLRSRMAANEASAVGSLRVINSSEVTYASTYNAGYTCDLTMLGPPASGASASSTAAGLIDAALATGHKSGYTVTAGNCITSPSSGLITDYQWLADPSAPGTSGTRHFCTDQSYVVRVDPNTSSNCLSIGSPVG